MIIITGAAWGQTQVRVVTLDSKTYQGTISKMQKKPQMSLVLQVGKQEKTIPALDIVEIVCREYSKTPGEMPCFVLHDGSRLFADIEEGTANSVGLRTLCFGLVALEINQIREIRFSSELGDVAASKEQDTIYFKKQEKGGQLQSGDTMSGVVEQFAKDHIVIQHQQLGTRREYYDKIERITLAQIEAPPPLAPQMTTILLGVDGSKLTGEITNVQNNTLSFVMPYLQKELQVDLQQTQRLFFINGRFVYVSDLPPNQYRIEYKEYISGGNPEPFMARLDQCWHRPDGSVIPSPIRLQGQLFYKGIGTISKSEITIALHGKYSRFQSQIGIDDCVREAFEQNESALRIGGSVVFQVIVDGTQKFNSGVRRWCDPPQTVDIDVADKKSLLLVVDWADEDSPGSGNDFADWAGARLIK
jgi:hypothetical protein